ncbi:hypothetical protein D3C87_63100 [compost metagenome]
MTLRISIAVFALSFLFGAAGSANAAEQTVHKSTSSSVEMNASTNNKKDFRPKKRKKSKPRKRHCDAY